MFSQRTTWTHRSDPLPQRQAAWHWRAADRNLSARCTQALCPHSSAENISHSCFACSFHFSGHYLSHHERFSEKCFNLLSKERQSRSERAAKRNTAFRWSCQRSTRGSKNVRHVWTSLSQKPWGGDERGSRRGELDLKGKGGRSREHDWATWKTNRGQSHQTGLPRFQSLLTFVNHQPVSLHGRAVPAVTPSTQTVWQQLLCLKEGLWVSQH